MDLIRSLDTRLQFALFKNVKSEVMIGFNDLINKQLRFIGELKYNCTIPKLAT
jgi:hypothetical protein